MKIIVPYRDREAHLNEFLKRLAFQFDIVVVEQADSLPFNRAKLINVGFLESEQPDYFIAHDVDMIPVLGSDYNARIGVTQLAGSKIQLSGYLGGVTMYDAETFKKAGGYHNQYFHRAEDNEMRFNLQHLGIPVLEKHLKYEVLPHARTGLEFDAALWEKSQRPRIVQDQLAVCRYNVIKRIQEKDHLRLRVIF